MDDLPLQLDPAIQALDQPRQRILLANSTGFGKTVEVGILPRKRLAKEDLEGFVRRVPVRIGQISIAAYPWPVI
jgi:hypothetical protein